MAITVPTCVVAGHVSPAADAAVSALRQFGAKVNRDTAAVLLSMWSGRASLTPADRLVVLDAFGSAPTVPAHDGYRIGTR